MSFFRQHILLGKKISFPDWKINANTSSQFLKALKRLSKGQADDNSTFGNLAGTTKWAGGVLASNGMIYGIPCSSTSILKIDPTNDTASTFGSLAGATKWYGGILAPNGMIYGIPYDSTSILKIDPTNDTTSTFGSLAGTTKWVGGVLASNGMIYGIAHDSTSILKILNTLNVNINFPLSRLVNKF